MDGKLNDFLGFFKKIVFTAGDHKQSVLRVIKDITHVELTPEQIVVERNSIHFRVSPGIKNHLFIKKDDLLRAFKNEKLEIISIKW